MNERQQLNDVGMLPSAVPTLVFYVNGKKVIEENADPEWTLLFYLRKKLGLTGTKLVCAEGGCGACTVMVSRMDRKQRRVIHMAVNACLFPVCSAHGLAITTVEGIGNARSLIGVNGELKKTSPTSLHPVQERIALAHGSQCGFCTPGMVMSMYALLRSLPNTPSMETVEKALHGNLCRCTGYRPILEGFRTFTIPEKCTNGSVVGYNTDGNYCGNGNGCCRNMNGSLNGKENESSREGPVNGCSLGSKCCTKYENPETDTLFDSKEFLPLSSTQEPTFPPELQISSKLDEQFLVFQGRRTTWYRPLLLDELLTLKKKYPNARIVVGNTEIGVEVKFKNCTYPVLVNPSRIQELSDVNVIDHGVKLGAAVTLDEVENILRHQIENNPAHKTKVFKAFVEMLHWFAGKQIRNVAGIAGNIMTGSPISDLNPILMAAGCELEVMSLDRGKRSVVMDEHFFTGYRKNSVGADEVLVSITLPYTSEEEYFFAYKQAKRKDDDIAIVNAGMRVEFEKGSKIIKSLALAFGGMAPTTVMAVKTANKIKGREWNKEMIEEAYTSLIEDLPIPPDAPGGVVQYRRSLSLSFFFRFYLKVSQQLPSSLCNQREIPPTFVSGADPLQEIPFESSQYFKMSTKKENMLDPVGKPVVHIPAVKQATGEAVYCDDMPQFENEAYMVLIKSTQAKAKILEIDTREAVEKEGFLGIFTAADIAKGRNGFGPIIKDEEVFANGKVVCHGQIIAAVIAENQVLAIEAARAVNIKYDHEEKEKCIITIEDAIHRNSFFDGFTQHLEKGNVEKGFEESDHIVSGEVRIGGQEHFYLETMSVIAVPSGEDSEMKIYCTTQNPTDIQAAVAHVLGIPQNRVVCQVKRMGGAFGGKESRSSLIAIPAAVAAHKLNIPVRCVLDRDEDMMMTGTRHPFLGKYKVGFTKEGKLNAYELKMYSNGGHSMELSCAVLSRSVYHLDNAYNIPNVKCSAFICKTNLPSNTGFRGFGAPQAMFFAENMIRHVAAYLRKDILEVTYLNLYKSGDKTHYNQALDHCPLQKCWEKCLEQSDYFNQKCLVDEYNRKNRWKKKGLSVVPTKLGIGFAERFLNQAGALVLVYVDGSVLLTHGGTEMGQGLHTKMLQVASSALGIPESLIHICETSTDKVPNTSATAGSASSDLNGMAVLDACEKILQRISPYKISNPNGTWKDWVDAAYMDRVSLSATGFHRTPGLDYDSKTNSGRIYNYFTYGVACSQVEIDCLTGDHQVQRTDIVMDIGESINPAVDVGQIEGGFIQGMGLFTTEELHYSVDGSLLTRGPGAYKIPSVSSIPRQFHVTLLSGALCPRAIYSSKAMGEPPLFLSSSVFFAIKEAISSARLDSDGGKCHHFRLDSPATSAAIRMFCTDCITDQFPEPDKDTFKPWSIRP